MDDAQAVGEQVEQAIPVPPPLPASNMEELQEQLRQKERMFQKACRAVREAELRAEYAEGLLETKQGILEGSTQQAECNRLINECLQAKREAKESQKKCEVLEREISSLKKEVDEGRKMREDSNRDKEAQLQQIGRLKDELKEARREAEDLKDSMKKKCEMHDKEKAILKEEVDDERKKREDSIRDKQKLEQDNELLKTCLSEANSRERELSNEISMLKCRLTQLEELQQQQVTHTMQDHSMDDSGDFDAERAATNPSEGINDHPHGQVMLISNDHDSSQSFNNLSMNFENETDRTEDHDYIGSNPNAKVPRGTSQFPVMGGVTDQYLNGETNDPCDAGVPRPESTAPGSFLRKPQHPGGTTFREVKGNDFVRSGSKEKLETLKKVTLNRGSPKNKDREITGDRLMGRAMARAGLMQRPQGDLQPHHPPLQATGQEKSLNPMVGGQKITPRGKTGLQRDDSDDSDDDKRVISCICGQKEDDGEALIGCDQCIVRWEHVDCIFPRSKKVPTGLYFCHVCKPRPTELTPEQARAYQDRVKMQKEEARKKDLERKLSKKAKEREERVESSSKKIVQLPQPVMKKEKKRSGERKRGAMNDANEDSDASLPVVSPPKKTAAMEEEDV